MNFKKELAKWGYNKGNSIDVETLTNEILPILFSKQKVMYNEDEVIKLLQQYRFDLSSGATPNIVDTTKDWFIKHKKQ